MRTLILVVLLAVAAGGFAAPTQSSESDATGPTPTVVYNQRKWPLLSPESALSSLYEKAKATPTAVSVLPSVPVPSDVAKVLASAKAATRDTTTEAARTVAARQGGSGECTNPEIHREWRSLTSAQKTAYVDAVKCLSRQPTRSGLQGAQNRWDDLVSLHQLMSDIIHNVGQFLPWHRYFLKIFESELRNTCGYTGDMVWWDETKDAGHFHLSPVSNVLWFGHLPQGNNRCIRTGVFNNTQCHIGPGTSDINHCMSRGITESLSSAITMSFVNTCNSYGNFEDMNNCVFFGPHAYGHDAIGGDMSDVNTSPNDPLFHLHHGFIDRNWRAWQLADPASRTYAIGGYTRQNCGNNCQPTTLQYQLTSFNFYPAVTVDQVMDTLNPYLCYVYDY